MKKWIITLAALALVACASPAPIVVTETAPAPSPEITTLPPVPVSSDQQYLAGMRSADYDFSGATDEALLEVGHAICDTLDLGVSVTSLAVVLATDDSIDSEMVGVALAGAVVLLCPEYTDSLDEFIDGA